MLTVQLGFLRDRNTVLESSIISGSLQENKNYNSPTVVYENIYTAVLFSHLVYWGFFFSCNVAYIYLVELKTMCLVFEGTVRSAWQGLESILLQNLCFVGPFTEVGCHFIGERFETVSARSTGCLWDQLTRTTFLFVSGLRSGISIGIRETRKPYNRGGKFVNKTSQSLRCHCSLLQPNPPCRKNHSDW